jgi:hypothetical protein
VGRVLTLDLELLKGLNWALLLLLLFGCRALLRLALLRLLTWLSLDIEHVPDSHGASRRRRL